MNQLPDTAKPDLLSRLKRRGVLRVAGSYVVIAWLLLQIGDVVLDPFDFGDAAMRIVLLVVAIGLPVALLLAWFFELTPEGLERDQLPPDAARPAVSGLRRYADIFIIGVLVIIISLLLANQGGLLEEPDRAPVVAVLPFANLSPEAADGYFGEGLADTLIHKLGQLNELVVLASQSTFQYTGRNLDLGEVGQTLGASVIMIGTVQRAGPALRVNVRLLEVNSGHQLWAETYDRSITDVFAIQDEIAASATKALHLVLSPEASARMGTYSTSNLNAYDAYLLGIKRLSERRGESHLAALEFFQQAIEADPDYALAYTGLVEAYYLMGGWPGAPHDWLSTHEAANDAAQRAFSLAPELGEAWLARALVAVNNRYFHNSDEAQDDEITALFDRAIELSPSNAIAHKYYANFLSQSAGDSTIRSTELLTKAARLDPRSGIIKVNLGQGAEHRGDFEAAEVWYRQAINTAQPVFTPGIIVLLRLHQHQTGQLDEVARLAVNWFESDPSDYRSYREAVRALLDLGLIESAIDIHARFHPDAQDESFYQQRRITKLRANVLLERFAGDMSASAAYARQLSREFWEPADTRVDIENQGVNSWSMTALAINDIHQDQVDEALGRQLAVYNGGLAALDLYGVDVLAPPLITAALYKHAGLDRDAETLLRGFLSLIESADSESIPREATWIPFTVHAMLGENDAALAELQAVVEAGSLGNWWALKEGAIDADYAAVLDDPRVANLFGQIDDRIAAMRSSYLARPELEDGVLPARTENQP